MNISRALQAIVKRILNGEVVPVRKEYQSDVIDLLEEQGIKYITAADPTNPNRIRLQRRQNKPDT